MTSNKIFCSLLRLVLCVYNTFIHPINKQTWALGICVTPPVSAQTSAQRGRAGRKARLIKWRHCVMSTGSVRHLEVKANHGQIPLSLIPRASARSHSALVHTVRPAELEDKPHWKLEAQTPAMMAGKRAALGAVLVGGGASGSSAA